MHAGRAAPAGSRAEHQLEADSEHMMDTSAPSYPECRGSPTTRRGAGQLERQKRLGAEGQSSPSRCPAPAHLHASQPTLTRPGAHACPLRQACGYVHQSGRLASSVKSIEHVLDKLERAAAGAHM